MADNNKLIDIKGLEVVYEDILTTLKDNYVKNSDVQESKTVTPTTSSQTIKADTGKSYLKQVVVDKIPSKYKDTTGANAVQADVRSGKKFVNTNGLQTGNMPDASIVASGEGEAELGISFTNGKIKASITDGTFDGGSFNKTITQGYLDEDDSIIDHSFVVSGSTEIAPKSLDSNLVEANIVTGISIFGVKGTFSQVDSDKAAYNNDIIEGKEAFVNGYHRVGTLKKITKTVTPDSSTQEIKEDNTVYHTIIVNPIPSDYKKVSETTTAIAANSISANVAYTVNNSNVTASNKVIVMPSNAASTVVWGKYGISVSSTQSAGKVILTALYNVTEAFSVDIITIG